MNIQQHTKNHAMTIDFKTSERVGKTDGWRTEPDGGYTYG